MGAARPAGRRSGGTFIAAFHRPRGGGPSPTSRSRTDVAALGCRSRRRRCASCRPTAPSRSPARCRSIDTLWPLLGACLSRFTPSECRTYVRMAATRPPKHHEKQPSRPAVRTVTAVSPVHGFRAPEPAGYGAARSGGFRGAGVWGLGPSSTFTSMSALTRKVWSRPPSKTSAVPRTGHDPVLAQPLRQGRADVSAGIVDGAERSLVVEHRDAPVARKHPLPFARPGPRSRVTLRSPCRAATLSIWGNRPNREWFSDDPRYDASEHAAGTWRVLRRSSCAPCDGTMAHRPVDVRGLWTSAGDRGQGTRSVVHLVPTIWWVVSQKNGACAWPTARARIGQLPPRAWLHKLSRMVRPGRDRVLSGGRDPRGRARGGRRPPTPGEEGAGGHCGRGAGPGRPHPDAAGGRCLSRQPLTFVQHAVQPGSVVITDGRRLPKRGYRHDRRVLLGRGESAEAVLPRVHRGVAPQALAPGYASGRRQSRASRLLPRRVHLSVQSTNLTPSREASAPTPSLRWSYREYPHCQQLA